MPVDNILTDDEKQFLIPDRISRIEKRGMANKQISLFVSNWDLVLFTRYFAVLVRSGISAFRSLYLLEKQEKNVILKGIIKDITERLEKGEKLYQAFSNHQDTFGDLFVALIRVGEESGNLYESLEGIADHLESRMDLRRKIISALSYPLLIGLVIFTISMAIFFFVVPKFEALYWQLDLTLEDLPEITLTMMWLSSVIRAYLLHFLSGFFILLALLNIAYNTEYGRYLIDSFLLKLPGGLSLKLNLVRFTENLSILFSSGFTVLNALDRSIMVVQNMAIRSELSQMLNHIENGKTISQAFEEVKIVPDMTVQMVMIGEETASFDEMMKHIARFYRKDLDFTIQSITSWLEPGIIIFLGIAVTVVLLAIYLPIFSLASKIKVV